MKSYLPKVSSFPNLFRENWRSGLTVALISVPLSIALSIASGAGPVPGIITGVWATLIAALFGGNNYNVIGAAGALSTILFAATLLAPNELGAAVLPLLALATGAIIFIVWALSFDRFLYYIPESVMYGFATGVAVAIATGQLFDAAGLSFVKKSGTFIGNLEIFSTHVYESNLTAVVVFAIFLTGILLWKKYITQLPAVIPAAGIGVAFGWVNATFFNLPIISLSERFGGIHGAIFAPVRFDQIVPLLSSHQNAMWLFGTALTIALVAVLETLITAKIADRITRTQSSSRKELFGLALANIGSGVMGGLPATGVFIRTGANIKAGATHRTSSAIAAVATGIIAVLVLPSFGFIPMAVIAAILVNTAIGLIETKKFIEYWKNERQSFFIALLVTLITILVDAGTGVLVGAIVALLIFVNSISTGRFDVVFNYADGTTEEERGKKILRIPSEKKIAVLTYSIAGVVGYIDAERHATNLRQAARSHSVQNVIVRLRNLFSIDYEAALVLAEAAVECERLGKRLYFSSVSEEIEARIRSTHAFSTLATQDIFVPKTTIALTQLTH